MAVHEAGLPPERGGHGRNRLRKIHLQVIILQSRALSFPSGGLPVEATHLFVFNPTGLARDVAISFVTHAVGCSPRYTYKGNDRAEVEITRADGAAGDPAAPAPQVRDEIKQYIDGRCAGPTRTRPCPIVQPQGGDMRRCCLSTARFHACPCLTAVRRFVSAPEACWRLLDLAMHGRSHNVERLDVYEEGCQMVYIGADEDSLAAAAMREHSAKTTLTEYFTLNRADASARSLLYQDLPLHYTWNKTAKVGRRHQHGCGVHVVGCAAGACAPSHLRLYVISMIPEAES